MNSLLAAFFVGILFALGLGVAGMTKPSKVLNFLDIAGTWDPSLMFVMIGAIGVYASSYKWISRRHRPLLTATFDLPQKQNIDRRLLLGATLFGIGWGIAGFCPGPAFVALGGGISGALLFVVAMTAGIMLARK